MPYNGLTILLGVILFIANIIVAIFVYFDARDSYVPNPGLWALICIFQPLLLSLPLYFIIKPLQIKSNTYNETYKEFCYSCGKSIDAGLDFCPHCGKPQNSECPECKAPVKAEWKNCPNCGTSLIK